MSTNCHKTEGDATVGRSRPVFRRVLGSVAFMAVILGVAFVFVAYLFPALPASAQTATHTATQTATETATATATATPSPHLVINPTSLNLAATVGATATFTLRLGTRPSLSQINVELRSSNSAAAAISANSLRIEQRVWSTPISLTVTAGSAAQAGESARITITTFSDYGNLSETVTVNFTNPPSPTPSPSPTPTSTPTPSPSPTPTSTPTPTVTPTPTPMATDTPSGNTPTPTMTPTPTPTNTSPPPPPPPGGNTPTPTNTSPPPPPPGGNTPTAMPTQSGGQPPPATRPGGQPQPTNTPASGDEEAWVAPGMVKHAGAPAQVFGSGSTHHFYFVGPGGVQSGPSVPSVSELARRHPKGSPVVTLWTGANPLTGKAVRIEYLPDEEKILYTTAYLDKYYKRDKPYIFTIDKDGKVTHRAW